MILTQNVFRRSLASITATIRPEVTVETLLKLVYAGVTVFRVNLSWYSEEAQDKWRKTVAAINDIAQDKKIILGIMLDTMGPEFRVGELDPAFAKVGEGDRLCLEYEGEDICLTLDPSALCTDKVIAITGPDTTFESVGKHVVFGDGNYRASIVNKDESDNKSIVIRPNERLLIWHKSKVNFPGTGIKASTMSGKETQAIGFFVNDIGASLTPRPHFMFAQSFVKSASDIIEFRGVLHGLEIYDPIIIAKMETYESCREPNLNEIVAKASAVMIARGDLANETSRREVPQLQRKITKECKELGKPVLLATQVYNSMKFEGVTHCMRPEAEDVRSALELGVDGFVLTEETVLRKDPWTVVEALAEQIESDERDLIENNHYESLRTPVQQKFQKSMRDRMAGPISAEEQQFLGTKDFAIAAVFRANTYRAIGIFPFTALGGTVRAMSEFYPETMIYALTANANTAQLLLLHRCTHPILIDINKQGLKQFGVNDLKNLVREVVDKLQLRNGSHSHYAISTMAHPPLLPGGTDTLLRIRL